MSILFKVDSREGEESIWISEISEDEFNILNPLLLEIQKNNGYYPYGEGQSFPEPTPADLYKQFDGFKYMTGRLPTPIHGFTRIEEVQLFGYDPKILYM